MGQVMQDVLPAVSASGTSAKIAELGVVPQYESTDNDVMRITLVSPAAQAAQGGTNFLQIQVRRIPMATGSPGTPVVLGTFNLGTTALVADTPVNLTLASPPQSNLQAGDLIDVWGLQTGTGGALTAGVEVQLELE